MDINRQPHRLKSNELPSASQILEFRDVISLSGGFVMFLEIGSAHGNRKRFGHFCKSHNNANDACK